MLLINKNWLAPMGLLALGLLNIASGAVQLSNIAEGPTEAVLASNMTNTQYFVTPFPVVIHIISGTVFNLFAPFQFVPTLRRNGFHKWSGRILMPAGLVAALTSLWMNQFFPGFGIGLKYAAVWALGVTMFVCLFLALLSILKRDIALHRAWMIRAVAMSLAPAVQRVILLPYFIITGDMSVPAIEVVVCTSFVLNLAFAEWVIRR